MKIKQKTLINLIQYLIILKYFIDYLWDLRIFGIPVTHLYSGFLIIVLIPYYFASFVGLKEPQGNIRKLALLMIILLTFDLISSLFTSNDPILALNYFIRLSSPLIIFAIFYRFSDSHFLSKLTKGLVIIFLFNLVYSIINLSSFASRNYGGPYYFKLDLARYTLALFILSLSYTHKRTYKFILVGLTSFLLLLTNSRISIIVAFLCFIYSIIFKSKKSSAPLALLIVIGLVILSPLLIHLYNDKISNLFESKQDLSLEISNHNFSGRFVIFSLAWDEIKRFGIKDLIFGKGYAYLDSYTIQNIGYTSHNAFISLLADNGIFILIGLVMFYSVPFFNIKYITHRDLKTNLFALFCLSTSIIVYSITTPGFYTIQLTWIYASVLALFLKQKSKVEESKQ